MNLPSEICHRAIRARDSRYDGRFFTCVKTTGIYCRPICPARPPKLENCIFVPTAAAAQERGFRPCLRCRPENSPEVNAWQGTLGTVSRAWKLIEAGALDEGNVASLADRLEIGDRQLRRLFRQHIGASPITVAQTRRVLLARQLIHQTDLPMIEVAYASGFGSVRRFNEAFQRLYQRRPSEIRRHAATPSPSPKLSILLPYQPPYDWDAMIRFFKARAIDGVEVVTDDAYRRVVELEDAGGTIQVTHVPEQSSVRATIRFPNLKSVPQIIARIRRQFDLSADPLAIADVLSRDELLAPLVQASPGVRLPGGWNGFEVAIRAILGQQITVKGATRLASRLVAELGVPVNPELASEGLTHIFPQPERFHLSRLAKLGMPRARAKSLVGMAKAVQTDRRLFDPRHDLADAVSSLRALPGIGEWTAQYIALRALGESDAFLAGDVGLQRQMTINGRRPTMRELLARAEQWRPWRGYALIHLWNIEHDSHLNLIPKEADNAVPT